MMMLMAHDVLLEPYLDVGEPGGEAVEDVAHVGVPGGAEEAAGHGLRPYLANEKKF